MRKLAAFALMSSPAFAHADHVPHAHGNEAYWIAAVAVTAALFLTVMVKVQKARLRAKK